MQEVTRDNSIFVIVPKTMITDTNIPESARMLWLYFASMDISGKRGAFPSVRTICKDLGYGREKVFSLINALEDTGILRVENRERNGGKIANLYHIVLPETFYLALCNDETAKNEVVRNQNYPSSEIELPQFDNRTTPSSEIEHINTIKIREHNIKEYKSKYTDGDVRLVGLLFELMLDNNPTMRRTATDKDYDSMRLLRERDGREPQVIEAVIRWSQQDRFWHINILSVAKLREKFDRLMLQAREEGVTKQNRVIVV